MGVTRRMRFLAPVALAAYLSAACTTWQPEAASPRLFIEESHPDRIRVTPRSGDPVIFEAPRIERDSIVGGAEGGPGGMSLTEVQELEVRRTDWQQTAVVSIVAGALIVASAFACFGFISACGDGS